MKFKIDDIVKLNLSKVHPSQKDTFDKYKNTKGVVELTSHDDNIEVVRINWPDGCHLTKHFDADSLLHV